MLFLVVSTPRPERPSELATTRQSFWPWIAGYEARGVCRHIYARAGRGAVAVLDVANNETLHKILNEWADIIGALRRLSADRYGGGEPGARRAGCGQDVTGVIGSHLVCCGAVVD